MTEVLYRKWRSQTFSELVGQEHVTTTLLNALAQGRLAHAYLFTGPRGTGKTSTARLLAKAINCDTNGGRGEPCTVCHSCREIADGRALDVVEIDAASNSKVDDVRELIDRVDYQPTVVGRKRIYIVDEVHMLSTSAFNALLKTLEEPPAHVVFILATTDVQKLPATVVSRCQRFDFRRIPFRAMVHRLEHIAAEEGFVVEGGGLDALARAAHGSLRDGANLLDQAVVYFGSPIGLDQIREMLGLTDDQHVQVIVTAAFDGDAAAALSTVQGATDAGADPRQLNAAVVLYLRDLLRLRTGGEVQDQTEETIEAMRALTARLTVAEIARLLGCFAGADFKLEGPMALPLELAIVEAITGARREPVANADRPAPLAARPIAARPPSPPAPARPVVPAATSSATPSPGERVLPPAPAPTPAPAATPTGGATRDLDALLTAAIAALKGNTMQAILRSCRFDRLEGETLHVICSSGFHLGRIREGKAVLETVLEPLLGFRPVVDATEGTLVAAPKRPVAPAAAEDEDDEYARLIKQHGGIEVREEQRQ